MSDAVKTDLCGEPTGEEQERQCTRKRSTFILRKKGTLKGQTK